MYRHIKKCRSNLAKCGPSYVSRKFLEDFGYKKNLCNNCKLLSYYKILDCRQRYKGRILWLLLYLQFICYCCIYILAYFLVLRIAYPWPVVGMRSDFKVIDSQASMHYEYSWSIILYHKETLPPCSKELELELQQISMHFTLLLLGPVKVLQKADKYTHTCLVNEFSCS